MDKDLANFAYGIFIGLMVAKGFWMLIDDIVERVVKQIHKVEDRINK